MKPHLKNYLSITKKEWNGMLVLVVIIICVLAAPYVYGWFHTDTPVDFKDFDKAVALLNKAKRDSAGTYADKQPGSVQKAFASNKLKPGQTIELNSADSAKLTRVHGIGAGFAMRIIRYRNRLGGFCKLEQLKEVYELDDKMYAEIKPQLTLDTDAIIKVDINTISFASLRQSPYLGYKQASAIIEYRTQHGKYSSMSDLQNIAIITPQILSKIEPYIKFK